MSKRPNIRVEAKVPHEKAMEALKTKLKEALDTCVLENGYPNLESGNKWGWNFALEAEKQRRPYLSLSNAWGILIDLIKECFEHLEYAKLPNGPLKQHLNPTDLDNLQLKIINFIYSFPRTYSIYIRLFGQSNGWENFKVNNEIEVIHLTENHPLLNLTRGWPRESSLEPISVKELASGKIKKSAFPSNSILVKIAAKGFIRNSLDDSALAKGFSNLKCLLYLGKINEVFTHEDISSTWGVTLKNDIFFTDETAANQIVKKIELPHDLAVFMTKYQLSKRVVPTGLLSIDNQKISLEKIGLLLGAPLDDVNKNPLTTATEWAFDAQASSNETVSFIQLCIALEAILGDDSLKDGITKTLSDRCAYLIGTTPKSRDDLRKRFEKLYDHRSKLVHGRRVKLEKEAEESLMFGQAMIDSILSKELRNFKLAP